MKNPRHSSLQSNVFDISVSFHLVYNIDRPFSKIGLKPQEFFFHNNRQSFTLVERIPKGVAEKKKQN